VYRCDYLEVIDSTTCRRHPSADVNPTRKETIMRSPLDVRALFRADATFEAAFGSLLAVGAVVGLLAAGDIPLSRTLVFSGGIAFLAASTSQFVYFIRSPRRVLLELAAGNVAMAAAGLTWLALGGHFSTAGVTLVAAASAWKLAIGALQGRSLMRTPLPR
jgi:hypothetical protein